MPRWSNRDCRRLPQTSPAFERTPFQFCLSEYVFFSSGNAPTAPEFRNRRLPFKDTDGRREKFHAICWTTGDCGRLRRRTGRSAARRHSARTRRHRLASASAQAGGPDLQVYARIDVPTGKNLDFTYGCPDAAPTAVNGAFYANGSARAGLSLVSNFRNGQNAAKWEWIITWPAGAPPNAHITFNVYCQT